MNKKILVIYNPVSGKKKWMNIPAMIQSTLILKGFDYVWMATSKKNNFTPYFKHKYFRVVVSGGDGTVSELASFMIKKKIKTPLIVLPQGSANLLAKALRLPLINMRHILVHGLEERGKALDAMLVNNRHYGLIAAGCGYDTVIMEETSRSLKRHLGLMAYFWTIFKTYFWYKSRAYKLTIDGKRYTVMAKSVMVFNILPYSHMAFSKFYLPKQVFPADGKLDVVIIDPRSIWDIFRIHTKLRIFRGKNIVIKPKKNKQYQIDGDVYKGKNVTIKAMPKAINYVYFKNINYGKSK
jgi:diacylglycerol kinase (ATP)